MAVRACCVGLNSNCVTQGTKWYHTVRNYSSWFCCKNDYVIIPISTYHLSMIINALKTGPCLNITTVFLCMGIHIIKMRRPSNHLIFIMGVPILDRWHFILRWSQVPVQMCRAYVTNVFVSFSCLILSTYFVGHIGVPCNHHDHNFVFLCSYSWFVSLFRWVCYWKWSPKKYFCNLSWQPIEHMVT